jgi:hypothetical protein
MPDVEQVNYSGAFFERWPGILLAQSWSAAWERSAVRPPSLKPKPTKACNVVTGEICDASAVLIRGAEGHNRPRAAHICTRYRRIVAWEASSPGSGLWFEDREIERPPRIKRSARIGVEYAGPLWAKRNCAFLVLDWEHGVHAAARGEDHKIDRALRMFHVSDQTDTQSQLTTEGTV